MQNGRQTTGVAARWQGNTALFLTSQCITLLGSSVVQMAIIWQVALTTSSGLWVTLLTISGYLPQAVVSLFSGAWADRGNRKRLIWMADAGIAAATLVLALWLLVGGGGALWPLVLVAAVRSFGAGVQTPAASAAVAQLVPQAHLVRYNGISGTVMALVQFAAPAAAAALLAALPFGWVLLLDVATALAGTALLLGVKMPKAAPRAAAQPQSLLADVRTGVGYALRTKPVAWLLAGYGVFLFLSVPSGFLSVLMIGRTFGENPALLATNEMAGFAGMVLGGALLGLWGGFKNPFKTLAAGFLGYAVFSFAVGFAGVFWLFAAMMFGLCLCIPVVQGAATAALQQWVPESLLGRVMGLLQVLFTASVPLGMAVFGPLADVLRIQTMVVACGLLLLVVGLFFALRRSAAPPGAQP